MHYFIGTDDVVKFEAAWGSHLFEEKDGKFIPTLWYNMLLKNIKHIVPNINHIQ